MLQTVTLVSIMQTERETKVSTGGVVNDAIVRAVDDLGTQLKLAEACGVSHTAVKKWLKGGGISAVSAKKIEDATQGKVTMREVAEGVNNE